MASISQHYTRRELARTATVTITVGDPPHWRVVWALGVALIRFGFRLIGFAGVVVAEEPRGRAPGP